MNYLTQSRYHVINDVIYCIKYFNSLKQRSILYFPNLTGFGLVNIIVMTKSLAATLFASSFM